jgi:hypothetical protein
MDMLHADFTTHDYAPHVHDSLVVAVTEAGGSEFKSRGRTDLALPQALLVFNPAEPHSGRMGGSERWRYRSFYVAEPAIKDVLSAVGIERPGYFTSNVVRDPDLVTRFLTLHQALDGDRQDALLHRELLVSTFGDLLQRHGQAARQIPKAPADAAADARANERDRGSDALPADYRVQANVGVDAARLPDSVAHQVRVAPPAGRSVGRRSGAHLRLLRPECAEQALQAQLRHDAAAVRSRASDLRLAAAINSDQ